MDNSIVDDHTWQQWANELETLQKEYPEFLEIGFYDKDFADWDGTTGNHLPLRDPWVLSKAQYILEIHEKEQHEQRTAETV